MYSMTSRIRSSINTNGIDICEDKHEEEISSWHVKLSHLPYENLL